MFCLILVEMSNISNITFDRNSTAGKNHVYLSGNLVEVIFLCIIGILILLGNSLVILAFMKGSRRLRTGTNYFVINLAVSDIMVGCICLPFWVAVRLGKEH